MRRVETVAGLRAMVADARRGAGRIALVPTMGALHDGHLELVRQAAAHVRPARPAPEAEPARPALEAEPARPAPEAEPAGPGFVVVSIFVNPLQFGEGEDFQRYPRDLTGDERALARLGAAAPDLVYAPTVSEMYPRPMLARVGIGELGDRLEGASRPGHFEGVCTVVAKLFHQVLPDVAFFGRKDFQQLQVVRRMVADLDWPLEVRGVITVREAGGLAMSSRNAYLSEEERRAALCLSRGLMAAVRLARQERSAFRPLSPRRLREATLGTIHAEPRAQVDYVEVVDPESLVPPDEHRGEVPGGQQRERGSDVRAHESAPTESQRRLPQEQILVAVAVRVGPARLIDNVLVGDEEDEQRLLDAAG